jgi:class 3 adenylate cyclase
MEEYELAKVHTLKKCRAVLSSNMGQFHGRLVDATGDNMLAEFASVVDAVECAVEIQKDLKKRTRPCRKAGGRGPGGGAGLL